MWDHFGSTCVCCTTAFGCSCCGAHRTVFCPQLQKERYLSPYIPCLICIIIVQYFIVQCTRQCMYIQSWMYDNSTIYCISGKPAVPVLIYKF